MRTTKGKESIASQLKTIMSGLDTLHYRLQVVESGRHDEDKRLVKLEAQDRDRKLQEAAQQEIKKQDEHFSRGVWTGIAFVFIVALLLWAGHVVYSEFADPTKFVSFFPSLVLPYP